MAPRGELNVQTHPLRKRVDLSLTHSEETKEAKVWAFNSDGRCIIYHCIPNDHNLTGLITTHIYYLTVSTGQGWEWLNWALHFRVPQGRSQGVGRALVSTKTCLGKDSLSSFHSW